MKQEKIKNRELVNYSFYAFVCLTIMLFTLIYYYLIHRHFQASVSELATFMIVSLSVLILLIVFCNSWSIWVANELGKRFESNKSNDVNNQICRYCGDSSPRFICNGCESILWYRLDPILGKLGVFFAHHRWKITAGILSLFFIGPINFSYELITKKVEQIKEFELESRNLLNSLTKVRALVFEIEYLANDSCTQKYEGLDKLYQEFIQEQHKISWSAPRIVRFLGSNKCPHSITKVDSTKDANKSSSKVDSTKDANKSSSKVDSTKNSQDLACDLIISTSFIDTIDILFVEYMKASKKFHDTGLEFQKKKKIAGQYHLKSRELGCIISELGLDLEQDISHPITTKYSCKEVFTSSEKYEEKLGVMKLWKDVEKHSCKKN